MFRPVQAGVGPALHIGVEQPVDDEERSIGPSDFAESDGQFVLAGIGRELAQQLAGRKDATGQGGSNPQDVRPVPHDHVLQDFVAGQSDQGFGNASGLEDMQPFRRQVPDTGDELVAWQGCDGEDMAGEAAGAGVLLTDAPPGPGHQQPVENMGRFIDRGRDGLRCEGSEPVRDMGIGLEARFAAIAGVDEVHCFALACGREELAVAGGGEAQAPEAGHGQPCLCLDHHGQGPVDRLAFDMPAREARELEEVMGVGGLGHLAETQIEPLGEEDVQESDPVLAWHAPAQGRENVGETGGRVHLQQDIGDPHLGQATIEVEHHLVDILRHCGGRPDDPECAILDGAAGYPAVARGIGETIQTLDQMGLVFGNPLPGFERNGQLGRCVRCSMGTRARFTSP